MRAAVLGLAAVVTGCGFGFADDSSGGSDALPTSGAGPFHRPATDLASPADEPWLATDRSLDLTEPELWRRDGGGFHYWVTREPADLPAGDTEIWRGGIRDPGQLPDEPPVPVLVAALPWEEGHVAAPAIVRLADRLVMFYEGGLAAPAIGRAESVDGGLTWTRAAAPVITGARSPGVGFDGTTWILAFVRPDAPGIWLARSTDGAAFAIDAAPVLTARPEVSRGFDAAEVTTPAVRWLVESSGRGHWGLWYAGLAVAPAPDDAPRYAVGFAASFDAVAWQRPAGGRPVLTAPAGAPAVIVDGAEAILLFDALNGRRPSVGVAIHP